MKIGEVARKAGVRTSAIRFYEKESFPRLLDKTDKGVMQLAQSASSPSLNSPERQGSQSLKSSYCFTVSARTLRLGTTGTASRKKYHEMDIQFACLKDMQNS